MELRSRGAVEAVLVVADAPVDVLRLAAAVQEPTAEVEEYLRALQAQWRAEERGYALREVAGGWQVVSSPEHADAVAAFVLDGQTARLTQAALETLAVIAYRQPVSRSRVAAVRGVSVDAVVRTLLTRGLVAEVGTDPETGATLFGTTAAFLERLGLRSLDDLPPLAPYLPEDDVLDELAGVHR